MLPRYFRSNVVSLCLLTVAVLTLSWSLQGWLTRPDLNGALWPADVNSAIVVALGGATGRDAVGGPICELSLWSVLLRLTAVLGALLVFFRWKIPDRLQPLTLRLSVLFFLTSSWWLLLLAGELGAGPAYRLAIGGLSLWVTSALAVFVWLPLQEQLPASSPSPDRDRSSLAPVLVLLVGVLSWTAVSFWLNFRLYEELLIPHGDSAMYEEHLWNVWHGKGFRSYLDQGVFLGEHIQVIHLLLLPLHVLWPSHLLLELSESFALASCAVPIFLMARRRTGDGWSATLFGLAWLLYFPMHFLDIAVDQKTFRPIALGLPFLFSMVGFAENRKLGWTVACLIPALAAKEDMALVAFPVLMVIGFRHALSSRRLDRDAVCTLGLGIGCLLYLVLAVLLVIPWFRSGEVVHYSRYFGDLGSSPGELISTALTSPMRVLRQGLTIQTLLYVAVFLVPLALLPLFRLQQLATGIITFCMLSLLQFGDQSGLPPVPYHHFHAPLLVVVFWAAISSLPTRLRRNDGHICADSRSVRSPSASEPRRLSLLVFLLCLCTGFTGSLMPTGLSFWSKLSGFGYSRLYASSDEEQIKRVQNLDEVLSLIPADARVASTDFIHTRLTHRERSYDYSAYLRKINNYQPGVSDDTQYIVIDRYHKYSEFRTQKDVPEIAMVNEWELLPDTTNGAYFVLKRRFTDRPASR